MSFDIILQTPPPISVLIQAADPDSIAMENGDLFTIEVQQVTQFITLSDIPVVIGTLTDGDKGDVVVSNGGNNWNLKLSFADGVKKDNNIIKLDIIGLQTMN